LDAKHDLQSFSTAGVAVIAAAITLLLSAPIAHAQPAEGWASPTRIATAPPNTDPAQFDGLQRRSRNLDPDTFRNPAVDDPDSDPIAAINQVGYTINKGINVAIEQPVTVGYRKVFPQPVRKSVRNFLRNIGSPLSMINQVAQGKPNRAGVELTRFGVNSTVGILGIFDVADDAFGIAPTPREDLGQTLGHYGVPGIVPLDVPVLGPTNVRDLTGFVGDFIYGADVTPGGNIPGAGPVLGIASRISVLDAAGPTAAFPEPQKGQTPYEARRIMAIKRRNAAIAE
jgi:phospholipid-binding lipoprotein MlaA